MKGRATFVVGVMLVNTVLFVPTPASGEATVSSEVYHADPTTIDSGAEANDSSMSPVDNTIIEFNPDPNGGVDPTPHSIEGGNQDLETLPADLTGETDIEVTVSESVYSLTNELSPPSNLEVLLQDEDSVTLHWKQPSQSDGLQGYRVYRNFNESGLYEPIEEVDISQDYFTDARLIPGKTYYYYVVAIYGQGRESAPSSVASVTMEADKSNPWVLKWTPNASKKVGKHAPITVTFDDYMNPDTINNYSFYVTDTKTKTVVPGSVKYFESEHKAIFVPEKDSLIVENTYEVTLTDAITNVSNLSLESFSYTFTTVTFTSPHGGYEVSSAPCAACHGTHASVGASLLTQADVPTLCMSCHNGEGSNVLLVEDKAAHRELRDCTECHDPHVPKTGVGTGAGDHPKGSA